MLRRKYLASNLKREKERTIARYLESFLSHIRDPQGGISHQDESANRDVTRKNAAVDVVSTKKEATGTKAKESNKVRVAENTVAIKLTPLEAPGTSKSPEFNKKKPVPKSEPSKSKSTQSKASQMYKNSSTQRLQDNEDIDDDSSLVDEPGRTQKYVLVGWDNFRSKLMLILLVLLVLWAVIYFPLIGT